MFDLNNVMNEPDGAANYIARAMVTQWTREGSA